MNRKHSKKKTTALVAGWIIFVLGGTLTFAYFFHTADDSYSARYGYAEIRPPWDTVYTSMVLLIVLNLAYVLLVPPDGSLVSRDYRD